MLGRQQMPVQRALDQYDVVASKAFGQKRKLTMGGTRGPRYKDSNLEEALQSVTQRDRLDLYSWLMPDLSDSKREIKRRSKTIQLASGSQFAART